MPELFDTEGQFSRRRFLAMGGAVAVAGAVGPWVDPLSALASTRWPNGRLGARDAIRVKQSEFVPLGQFRSWTAALDHLGPVDQKGLRATGTPAHEGYIDELHNLLDRAGVRGLHFDRVPMTRWTTGRWALQLLDGPSAGPVKTASYVPYSGRTSAQGIAGAARQRRRRQPAGPRLDGWQGRGGRRHDSGRAGELLHRAWIPGRNV